MKHGPSLEDERRALLEHIHSTRSSYRRMLMEIDEEEEARVHHRAEQIAGDDPAFPRSMTMRWLVAHPYASLAAVAVVAAGTPFAIRALAKWRRDQENQRFIAANAGAVPVAPPGTAASHAYYPAPVYVKQTSPQPAVAAIRAAATSLTAVAAMVLRDPAKMRMAMRLASNAAAWMRQRRAGHHM